MKKYFKLMRIHHYLKNGLIFLPLVFGGLLFDIELLTKAVLGFIVFSFLASTIYIINDIFDVEKDRQHSTKCNRPIASGAVSIKKAWILAGGLLIVSGIITYFSFPFSIYTYMLLVGYVILNFAYSMGLKNVPLVDIIILVSGYLIRVLFGSAITGIAVSSWLYLLVITISFYLGLGKRRNEIVKQNGETRKVLKYYNYNFLDKNMYMFLTLAIVFYSLWALDVVTIAKFSAGLLWTIPVVMLIVMKYNLQLEGNSSGDPIEVLLGDKILMALVALYIAIVYFIIY